MNSLLVWLKQIPRYKDLTLNELKNLKRLDLSSNQLTSIPKELGALKNLKILYLSYNQLTSIPKELGELKNLEYLHLYYNKLTSIPKELGELKNLEYLFLHNNPLNDFRCKHKLLDKFEIKYKISSPLWRALSKGVA